MLLSECCCVGLSSASPSSRGVSHGTRPCGSKIELRSRKENATSALLGGLLPASGDETKIRKATYRGNGLFNIGNWGVYQALMWMRAEPICL